MKEVKGTPGQVLLGATLWNLRCTLEAARNSEMQSTPLSTAEAKPR
ncbi:MAG: hypothetical protein ABSB35_11595 [Bryobacteraceae bacterium]|jgi:hypothetical protein